MRIYWFFLTLFSILICAVPVNAAQLLFWRFEAAQNRLTFTTDSGVQPQAQLIANPTRVVIDLPGIQLNRPTVNQNFGGAIRSLRIGQFDNQTTRLVIELAPGYTLDPDAIQFRGESPTQWSVELPTPERIGNTTATSSPTPVTPPSRPDTTAQLPPSSEFVKFTALGLYLPFRLAEPDKVSVQHDRDRNQVNISLEGVTLPSDVRDREIPVNRYGVSTIAFAQNDNSAELTLNVAEDSPDWWASVSRFGGVMIYPRGNTGSLADLDNNEDRSDNEVAQNEGEPAVIEEIELGLGGSPLQITSDREIETRPSRRGDTYQILIPNARLGSQVSDRSVPNGLSLRNFQIRENNNDVVITLVPNRGYTLGEIDRQSDRTTTIALEIGSASNPRPPANNDTNTIPVPPPENPTPPVIAPPSTPRDDLPRSSSGRVVAVIDPGHGGRDPGAIGIGGLREKDVVLPISLEVARLLQQQGVRVVLTRSNDTFISLAGRAQLANRSRATLFVSIHANAISLSRPDVNGVETFYFVSGRQLAEYIQGSILESFDMNNRGVKRARFYVLRNTSMPSALVETGFVTGREDAPRLANPQFRDDMAYAIARGILRYIQAQGL